MSSRCLYQHPHQPIFSLRVEIRRCDSRSRKFQTCQCKSKSTSMGGQPTCWLHRSDRRLSGLTFEAIKMGTSWSETSLGFGCCDVTFKLMVVDSSAAETVRLVKEELWLCAELEEQFTYWWESNIFLRSTLDATESEFVAVFLLLLHLTEIHFPSKHQKHETNIRMYCKVNYSSLTALWIIP